MRSSSVQPYDVPSATVNPSPDAAVYSNPTGAGLQITEVKNFDTHRYADESFQPVQMPIVPGYEFVYPTLKYVLEPGDIRTLLPPPYAQIDEKTPQPSPDYSQLNRAHIDESSARAALIKEIDKHCCYGSGAAKETRFTQISTKNAYHVTLNSFIESRDIHWTKLPYQAAGQPVDGPEHGLPPAPWDLPCVPPVMFKDQFFLMEVPHTSHIMTCPQCNGRGKIRCRHCHGSGYDRCSSCSGSGKTSSYSNGKTETKSCTSCSGSGRKTCSKCSGRGYKTCPCCCGQRQIRIFIQIRITFMDALHDKVLYSGENPSHEQITRAEGQEQWRYEATMVRPLEDHTLSEVNQCSAELVGKAREECQAVRVLMQRHIVRTVPVSECSYIWKNKDHKFWVYGTDHQVQLLDYPQTCCCCSCNIL